MSDHKVDTSIVFDIRDLEPTEKQIEVVSINSLKELKQGTPKMETIAREPYLPSDDLVKAVNLAIALGRPLLLQGDPGCGKTRLAYALAYALRAPLEISYIKSTSRAQDLLYTFDAVARLYDSQIKEKKNLAPENYVKLGPLGRAIARASFGRRSVVLIDEIDKADLDFPNDLLWELDRLEFQVHEAPTIRFKAGVKSNARPIVIVTHNEEKALPTAFLRRCIFQYIEFPETEEHLKKILALHRTVDNKYSTRAIKVLIALRKMDLRKKPGLSELIDWVGYADAIKTPYEDLDKLPHVGSLLKQQSDQLQALGKTPIKIDE